MRSQGVSRSLPVGSDHRGSERSITFLQTKVAVLLGHLRMSRERNETYHGHAHLGLMAVSCFNETEVSAKNTVSR